MSHVTAPPDETTGAHRAGRVGGLASRGESLDVGILDRTRVHAAWHRSRFMTAIAGYRTRPWKPRRQSSSSCFWSPLRSVSETRWEGERHWLPPASLRRNKRAKESEGPPREEGATRRRRRRRGRCRSWRLVPELRELREVPRPISVQPAIRAARPGLANLSRCM